MSRIVVFVCAVSLSLFSCSPKLVPTSSAASPSPAASSTAVAASPTAEPEPIWDANLVVLTKRQLAPGVFGVFAESSFAAPAEAPKPTSGGFIIGSKGVLVIESYLNRKLAEQLQALIKSETDLPITHIVNTSYHGDHSYGNMFLPATAQVIQHEATASYISQHFTADTQFMLQNFGKGRGIEEIKPRKADLLVKAGDNMHLDLGGQTVEIKTFGFGQTEGDLYIWHPASKTIWVGNVWVAPKPGLPWLLDGRHEEVLATMKKIRDFLPADARVIPGHHAPMGKADLDFEIDYLSALNQEVSQAVKKRQSLEQTVGSLSFEDFRGYPIFDWIHFQVNVPKAYQDLQKKLSPDAK